MVTNILVGTLMMLLTTGVHTAFTVGTVFLLSRWIHGRQGTHSYKPVALISGTILMFFIAALIEVGMWATAYLTLGAIRGIESSLYYSMVTFTTLGLGDITLSDRWRLLSSFEAANGIIMFGWTTAVVMAVVQQAFANALKRIRRKRQTSRE